MVDLGPAHAGVRHPLLPPATPCHPPATPLPPPATPVGPAARAPCHPDRLPCMRPSAQKERAVLQTPVMTRCTRLCFDDTRIITGSLNGTVVVLDVQ